MAALLTGLLGLTAGVAFGQSYFERKLFDESGKSIGPLVAISADGATAYIGGTVYVRSGQEWVPQHQLTGAEAGEGALSADGNTLVTSDGTDPTNRVAYVSARSGGVWAAAKKIEPTGKTGTHPRFGSSVAVSENGDTIVLGAPEVTGSGLEDVGGAWVFVRSGETWVQQAILGGEPQERCGEDVALSADGDTALVQCGFDVNVFVRQGEAWTQQGPALPGRYAAIAPDGDAIFATTGSHGYVYERSGESWSLAGEIPPLEAGKENGSIVVSADAEHLLIAEGDGVDVYQGSGASWTPMERLYPLDRAGNFEFATSSDASVILLALGALGSWEFTPGEPVKGPEVGRCVLHPHKGDATFHDSGCTKQSHGGSPYEWEPGALKRGFALSGGPVKLEAGSNSKITCSGLSGSGAFNGRKTLGSVELSLTGCALAGQPCTSAMANPGQINTDELDGELGVEAEGAKTKLGIGLSPVSGVFSEFTCGTTTASIRGGVIASVKSGKPASSSALKYAASQGAQKPDHFVGGPVQQLEVSFAGAPYEPIRLVAKAVQTYEETLVLNPAA